LAADRSVVAAAITLATVALGYFTRINPLWIFAGAAIIGMFGVV
jgi:chromate transporter